MLLLEVLGVWPGLAMLFLLQGQAFLGKVMAQVDFLP